MRVHEELTGHNEDDDKTHIWAIVPKMFCLRFQGSPTASPTGFYFRYDGSVCLHRLIKLVINLKPDLVPENTLKGSKKIVSSTCLKN